ncbi:helix-turn-helix domain-containing protein [Mobiluncus mulieris]|uniref:helix-turn-helix domain-containing protein n=1 Tax=Mobiluncus mulieris TaxID=2052 RepID=UPI0037C58415
MKPNAFTVDTLISGEVRAEMARQKIGVIDLVAGTSLTRNQLNDRINGRYQFSFGELDEVARVLGTSSIKIIQSARERAETQSPTTDRSAA